MPPLINFIKDTILGTPSSDILLNRWTTYSVMFESDISYRKWRAIKVVIIHGMEEEDFDLSIFPDGIRVINGTPGSCTFGNLNITIRLPNLITIDFPHCRIRDVCSWMHWFTSDMAPKLYYVLLPTDATMVKPIPGDGSSRTITTFSSVREWENSIRPPYH